MTRKQSFMFTRAFEAFVVVGMFVSGCGEDRACVEGRSVSCACPGGQTGVQVCAAGAFDECSCDGSDLDAGMIDASMYGRVPDAAIALPDGAVVLPDGAILLPDGAVWHPSDAATSADGSVPSCDEAESRCGVTGVEVCREGTWAADTTCAAGCEAGECVAVPAMCTPDATRCYRNSVQRCNRDGSAWLHDAVCVEGCAGGLCSGECTPGESRCNADMRETCATDGEVWSAAESCSLGCSDTVCVQPALSLPGTVVELSSSAVYEGCINVDLGGELRIAPGANVTLRARCLVVSSSSRVTLGAGASLTLRVAETAELAGTVSGGLAVTIEALESLSLAGTVTSGRSVLRADVLALETGATLSGTTSSAALYGSLLSNDAGYRGTTSVMPPSPIASPSHPSGFTWNLAGDDIVLSWSKPFASVRGYYILLGDAVPGPSNAELLTTESVTFSAAQFGPGANRVRIVSVNPDSVVGTYTEDYSVVFNVESPVVTSSSHSRVREWGGPDDVFLSWTNPTTLPAASSAGYFYAWTREADTVPSATVGTYDDRQMLLKSDVARGVWFFHIVTIDRFGRTSPLATHRQVRVGADPGKGNVAGTVIDRDTSEPIEGATILVSGGLMRALSTAEGDYTFLGEIPVSPEDVRVTVSAPGYVTDDEFVRITPGGALVRDFALVPGGEEPASIFSVGWERAIDDFATPATSVAVGENQDFVWSAQGNSSLTETVQILDRTYTSLMTDSLLEEYYAFSPAAVGWTGSLYYVLEYYKCLDSSASFVYGHGHSCLRMKTWDVDGATVSGWVAWKNSGQTGSPSVAWNGTTFGTFFISYDKLMFRELNAGLTFTDGLAATTNVALSTGHADSRQAAHTDALWDGSTYAVAWAIGRKSWTTETTAYFGRWNRDHTVASARIELGQTSASDIKVLYADAQYHVLFFKRNKRVYDLVLARISASGASLGTTVVASGITTVSTRVFGMAYTGRDLVVAHDSTGAVSVERRRVADYGLTDTLSFAGSNPRVSIDAASGTGVLLYSKDSATWVRTISAP